jgi:hypothetical protein
MHINRRKTTRSVRAAFGSSRNPELAVVPLETLKALTWDLVCFAVPTSKVELVWKAVQAWHPGRQFPFPPPMCEVNQFSSWSKMLGSIRGHPVALKLPIQKATVHWLLAWRPSTLAAYRARLMTVVATLGCMRVNEVARLQVCDLWFDSLMSYGMSGFEGTCSVHINRRKNDTQRKGHYPAFGRSRDPELEVVVQLRRWLELAGLAVHPSCSEQSTPAAACELCPPLFPLTNCSKGGVTVASRWPCTRQQASDWIRWAVKEAGGDSSRFSSISARKWGSTAIEARVDETILYLQSGHGAAGAFPARAYMQIAAPARFLETFEAFGL